MEYYVEAAQIIEATSVLPTIEFILIRGGILIVLITLIWGFWKLWMNEIQDTFYGDIPFVTLAINVPKQTEQTPKAVENIFSHFAGLYGGAGNLIDRYWHGKVTPAFSVELVGKGGYIQFFVHCPIPYRDVIEAAIYAQYPEAEITETNDYTKEAPQVYPDEKYDMWGTELGLAREQEYPIKTFSAFEHSLDGTFKDPLNSIFEFMGAIHPDEQVWMQIVLVPTTDDWTEASDVLAKKLAGVPVKQKVSLINKWMDKFFGLINAIIDGALNRESVAPAQAGGNEDPSKVQHLTPGEKMTLEQIQIKGSKPGFLSKIRIVYIAPKEIFNKGKPASGILGGLKQLQGLNGFKPVKSTKVGADYYRVEQRKTKRKNKLMKGYVARSAGRGGNPYILNAEELATIWHFPMIDTKAPSIIRAEKKTAEPPAVLPVRTSDFKRAKPKKKQKEKPSEIEEISSEDASGEIPGNLPFM